MQHFHLVTLLDLYLLTIRSILIRYLLLPLRSPLAKFGFAVSISPVSADDKAKSDSFDLSPDLDMACDLLKKIFKIP